MTPTAELMRSLGRLVRGLSALFWGLPLSFLVCYYTVRAEPLRLFGVLPPIVCVGLPVYGLWQLGDFQKQERIWLNALDRARVLGMINLGLSPFLFWSNRMPNQPFFSVMVLLMTFFALLFLASINVVLKRLGAMLPDEALRLETRNFTQANLFILLFLFLLSAGYLIVMRVSLAQLHFVVPALGIPVGELIERTGQWLLTLLALVPLAMTMALLWKIKEVILDSVFGSKASPPA